MSDFRFSDWDPSRGTVPAYFVGDDGLITVGEVLIRGGMPMHASGAPMHDDGDVVELRGWKYTRAASFNEGRVLVPLKGTGRV